uniref:Uncharacterized protein n=1 Tax=Oryza sativa subsp. japonica TaxID=39947 RepID=Q6K8A6_ORYSJ|nr:hypothetical protein [Oryza sativa Japonica Group]
MTLDIQRIRLDWINTLGKKPKSVNGMGAVVAGEPRHNNANEGTGRKRRRRRFLPTLMRRRTVKEMAGDGLQRAARFGSTAATIFRRRAAATDGWTGFSPAATLWVATAKLGDDGRSSRASPEIKTRRRTSG